MAEEDFSKSYNDTGLSVKQVRIKGVQFFFRGKTGKYDILEVSHGRGYV
jgi:hypothetical protein